MISIYVDFMKKDHASSRMILGSFFLYLLGTTVFFNFVTLKNSAIQVDYNKIFDERFYIALLSMVGMIMILVYMKHLLDLYFTSHAHEMFLMRSMGIGINQLIIMEILKFIGFFVIDFLILGGLSLLFMPLSNTLFKYLILRPDNLLGILLSGSILLFFVIIAMWYMLFSYDLYDLEILGVSHELKGHTSHFTVPDFLYILMFLLGLYAYFMPGAQEICIIFVAMVGAIGAYGCFVQVLPHFIEEYVNQIKTSATKVITLTALSEDLKRFKLSVFYVCITLIFMTNFIYFFPHYHVLTQLLLIALAIINIMTDIGFVLSFRLTLSRDTAKYHLLRSLGLEKRALLGMIKHEIILFYSCFFLFNAAYLAVIFSHLYTVRGHHQLAMLIILASFVGPLLISLFINVKGVHKYYENTNEGISEEL